MKIPPSLKLWFAPAITCCVTYLSAPSLFAALQSTTNQSSQASSGFQPLQSFTASPNDLAQNGATSLTSSIFSGATFFGTPVNLGNGVLDNSNGNGVYLPATFSGGNLPNTLTITLNTSTNTSGYDITGITTYAGHNENGSALANQQYLLEYSLVGDASFTSLGVQTHAPFNNTDTNAAAATQLILTDDTETIASGVDAIRLTFQDHGFTNVNAAIDGTVYREVDVFGHPTGTVPWPNLGAIWFIGDSITQSNADGDGSSSPRKSLYDLLTANSINFTYTGHHTANVDGLPSTGGNAATNLYHYHTGISGSVIGNNTTNPFRHGITQGVPSYWTQGRLATVKPNIILIMLGTNDTNADIDVANAPTRISTLINTIMNQPNVGNPVFFVAAIPPNRIDFPTRNNRVLAFNAALPDIIDAQRDMGRDVYYVDNYTTINDNYASAMRGDNLHPNTTGNNLMAQQWYNALQQRFAPTDTSSIAAWQFTHFGSSLATDAGIDQDPDNDNQTNLYEFAYGSDPNAKNDTSQPIQFDGTKFTVTRRIGTNAGLTYTLEESSTLQNGSWTTVGNITSNVTSTSGEFETVEITKTSGTWVSGERKFLRLKVEQSP